MTSLTSNRPTNVVFDEWLKAQIFKLSVDTLSEAVTCTACGEVLGTYIIDYQGNRFRCTPEEAYAFLKFIAEKTD